MHNKYLKGGSLNPQYIYDIQDARNDEAIHGLVGAIGEVINALYNMQITQIQIESIQREIEFRNKLEEAFDFYESHADTTEHKEMCKVILHAV